MLVDGEIAVLVLDADAVAVVDAPVGEHDGAVEGGVDDLVAVGGDIDAIVAFVGIEGLEDGAGERHEEVLDQRAGFGRRQVVGTKEVVLVLGLKLGTQQAVLSRLAQRDGVDDAFG